MAVVLEWLLVFVVEVVVLGLVLVAGKALSRCSFKEYLGEGGAALLIGVVAGGLIHLMEPSESLASKLSFQNGLFLYVLLPAIIFDAGYTLDPNPLIRNLGAICTYAFLGTLISTFVVGLLMWGLGAAGWCNPLSLNFSLLFGALISATDPVSVLAVFSSLGANEDLHVLVFGESVLNDAVAMELYNTIAGFIGAQVTAGGIFKGIGLFVAVFCGSIVMGVGLGLLAAWVSKRAWLRQGQYSLVESGLVVIIAYLSYLGAQLGKLSGICSVLFCAMVMRSFLTPNLTSAAQQHLLAFPKTLAGVFETFLFMQIGMSCFLQPANYDIISFACWSLVALGLGRIANVIPCSWLINWLRLPGKQVPATQQFMLWWSGLRGAMAFALAIDAAEKYGESGAIIKGCTFYVVLATVLYNGGSTAHFLDELDLKATSESSPLLPGAGSSTKDTDCQLAAYTGSSSHTPKKAKGKSLYASSSDGQADDSTVPSPHAHTIPYLDPQDAQERGLSAGASQGQHAVQPRETVVQAKMPRKTPQDVIWLPPPRYSTLFSWRDLIGGLTGGSYHGFGQGGVSDADLSRATSRKALEDVSDLARGSRDSISLAAPSTPLHVRSEAGLPDTVQALDEEGQAGGHSPGMKEGPHDDHFEMIELHEVHDGSHGLAGLLTGRPSQEFQSDRRLSSRRSGSLLDRVREFNSSNFDATLASWGRTLSQKLTQPTSDNSRQPSQSSTQPVHIIQGANSQGLEAPASLDVNPYAHLGLSDASLLTPAVPLEEDEY